jgi:hypothetical protein
MQIVAMEAVQKINSGLEDGEFARSMDVYAFRASSAGRALTGV